MEIISVVKRGVPFRVQKYAELALVPLIITLCMIAHTLAWLNVSEVNIYRDTS